MNNFLRLAALQVLVLLCANPALGQQEDPAPPADIEQSEAPTPDQEVEVTEDNYRQFMELRDDLRQRTVIPEDSFESRSGLQKLDNLPADSQKHLRNELREIISRGERWQPGDENADYPYVPSEAAIGNPGLQKQEAEAWGELLDNYHAREAQIYANSARSRAAAAASGAMPGQAGESPGDEGDRSGQAAQASQNQDSQPGNSRDSFAPGAQNIDGEAGAHGVAQNAMEFLENAGYQGGNAVNEAQQQQAGDTGQAAAQAQTGAQQGTARADAQSGNAAAAAQQAQQAQSSEGTQQNAMEFLQQAGNQQQGASDSNSQQAGDSSETSAAEDQQETAVVVKQESVIEAASSDSDEPATEGTSQNALEYLAGEDASAGDAPQDTLSIEDLLNAGGLGAEPTEEEGLPDKPDKEK